MAVFFFSSKIVFNKKLTLNNDSADSPGGYRKCMKYVIFLWSPVGAAHDCHSLARALQNSGSYWL
jgi:hypothetical protein